MKSYEVVLRFKRFHSTHGADLISLLSQKYANKISKVKWFIEDSFIVENISKKM